MISFDVFLFVGFVSQIVMSVVSIVYALRIGFVFIKTGWLAHAVKMIGYGFKWSLKKEYREISITVLMVAMGSLLMPFVLKDLGVNNYRLLFYSGFLLIASMTITTALFFGFIGIKEKKEAGDG